VNLNLQARLKIQEARLGALEADKRELEAELGVVQLDIAEAARDVAATRALLREVRDVTARAQAEASAARSAEGAE